jgi:hypothetical protein
MRLWTLHPRYLDAQGLTALWREGLLARAVLHGHTRGYRHHPQLQRFQAQPAPQVAIDCFLRAVLAESVERGYRFDATKLDVQGDAIPRIAATRGQLAHEWRHLTAKLRQRSPAVHARWQALAAPEPHPMFDIVEGPVEPWERA